MSPNKFLKRVKVTLPLVPMVFGTGNLTAGNSGYYYSRNRRGAYRGLSISEAGVLNITNARKDFSWQNGALAEHKSLNVCSDVELTQGNQILELIIIDEAVHGKSTFYGLGERGVAFEIINSNSDGLEQLASIIKKYQNLNYIHLISHARPGELQLGNTTVDAEHLKKSTSLFIDLNGALKNGGDLLLYGCELAKYDDEFLQIINENTHVDVAASNDLTGNLEFDGDWELEITKGDVNATPLNVDQFEGVLQQELVDFSSIYYAGNGSFGGDGSINASVNTPSSGNILVIDGADYNTQAYKLGGYYYGFTDPSETALTLNFSGGGTFYFDQSNTNSIQVNNRNTSSGITFKFTTDNGSLTEYIAANAYEYVDLTSLTSGSPTTYLKIENNAGGVMHMATTYLRVQDIVAGSSNTSPAENTNTGANVCKGDTVTIGQSNLEFTDAEEGASDITFTLDTAPSNGILKNNGTALSASDSFTQNDINNNLITYEHDGTATTSDSFQFDVSDGASGTVNDSTFSIVISDLSVSISTQTNASCNGENDGSATASGSGGSTPYSFSWSSGGTSATESSLSAGTHTVTITDADGCKSTAMVTITEPAAFDAGSIKTQ